MEKDLHHNLFGCYQGSSKDSEALENNVTKALINVLELSGGTLQQQFVDWLSDLSPKNLDPLLPVGFMLQASPAKLRGPRVKLLIGIKPNWANWSSRAKRRRSDRRERIYDGAIIGRHWIVAIESKIRSGMDADQFEDQRLLLGGNAAKIELTWKQVHDFLKCEFPKRSNTKQEPVCEFMTAQFCEYLEKIDLVGFQGFHEELFNCVGDNGAWTMGRDDVREQLSTRMYALAHDLHQRRFADGEKLTRAYPRKSRVRGLHRSKGEYNWAHILFYPRGAHAAARAHQCVLLHLCDGTLEVKAEISTREGIRSLRRKLGSDAGRGELTSILERLQSKCAPVRFDLYRDNRKDYPSLLAGGTHYINRAVTRRRLKEYVVELSGELDNHKESKHVKFELSKSFAKRKVVRTGSDLVQEIVDTMESLHPFVRFVRSRRT